MGCPAGVPDLFIHVATMDDTNGGDGGLMLQKDALDKVVAAFDNQGIAVHFDVGTTGLYDGNTLLLPSEYSEYNFEDLNNQITLNESIYLSSDVLSDDIKSSYPDYLTRYIFVDDLSSDTDNFPAERNNIFYFLVIGCTQEPEPDAQGSSGISWRPGNELLITLGNWGLNFTTTADKNLTANFQASTIMHEFGHSLGLRHGGNENLNYKPNYYSIMNYLYQLYGLPDIGNAEGDRYYLEYGYKGYTLMNQLINNPYSTSFKMDYSHGRGGDLYEGYLYESLGLRQSGSSYVDWNGNLSITSGVSMDINTSDSYYNTGLSTLEDYDDWDNLYFYYSALNSGVSRSVLDSQRELIVEEKPRFLDQIVSDAP